MLASRAVAGDLCVRIDTRAGDPLSLLWALKDMRDYRAGIVSRPHAMFSDRMRACERRYCRRTAITVRTLRVHPADHSLDR